MNVRPVFVIEDSSEEDDSDEQKLVQPLAVESDSEDHWCCWLFRKKR